MGPRRKLELTNKNQFFCAVDPEPDWIGMKLYPIQGIHHFCEHISAQQQVSNDVSIRLFNCFCANICYKWLCELLHQLVWQQNIVWNVSGIIVKVNWFTRLLSINSCTMLHHYIQQVKFPLDDFPIPFKGH